MDLPPYLRADTVYLMYFSISEVLFLHLQLHLSSKRNITRGCRDFPKPLYHVLTWYSVFLLHNWCAEFSNNLLLWSYFTEGPVKSWKFIVCIYCVLRVWTRSGEAGRIAVLPQRYATIDPGSIHSPCAVQFLLPQVFSGSSGFPSCI